VPGWIIEQPETITLEDIDKETNAEIRRVMIQRFGQDKYAMAGKLIHQDGHGRLWQRAVSGDEPVTMVEVFNPTAEPDGVYSKAEILARFGMSQNGERIKIHRSLSYIHDHPPSARYKTYFLRVHPECRPLLGMKDGRMILGDRQPLTAHAAVASTCGKTPAEYDPEYAT
jgi:hypothetical protein